MKTILFLVPKMNGPNHDAIWNSAWTPQIVQAVKDTMWKVVTPATLVLAAIAEKYGYQADLVDEQFCQADTTKYYDIVCIYTVTPNAKRAYFLAGRYKKLGSYIVIGGVHALFQQKEAYQHCDTLMLGEGEKIFPCFLNDFRNGAAKKIYFERKGNVDLHDSPTPLYRILKRAEQSLVPLQTARGCSNNCIFCNLRKIYGKGFRAKSYVQLKNETAEIEKLPCVKGIYVTNDNILSEPLHFKLLTIVMKETKKTWYANTDISFGESEKNIKAAYNSGLRQVLIGFESVNRNDLYAIDKSNFKYRYFNRYKTYIKKIQSNGIGIIGSFIVGHEKDKKETFQYLADFIYDTKLYGANVTMLTPYPGTTLYYKLLQKNRLPAYDWDHYTIFQPLMPTQFMTIEELNQCYLDLFHTIHSDEFSLNKRSYFKEVYKELKK